MTTNSTGNSAVNIQKSLDQTIWTIVINRPNVRNCVDRPTAELLSDAFECFENSPEAKVAILTGEGGNFCAGADLKAVASNDKARANRLERTGDGPMGPTRMMLSKPVIAAISGYCVAGGLELACWCDLRVADKTATFGVFCRRFGVPLIDGGTVRLPRLIGQSHALDLILTGRSVSAEEAKWMGLINRLSENNALEAATALAEQLCNHPFRCLVNDRASVYNQWGLSESKAIADEFEFGLNTLQSGETLQGANIFAQGLGRHGEQLKSLTQPDK